MTPMKVCSHDLFQTTAALRPLFTAWKATGSLTVVESHALCRFGASGAEDIKFLTEDANEAISVEIHSEWTAASGAGCFGYLVAARYLHDDDIGEDDQPPPPQPPQIPKAAPPPQPFAKAPPPPLIERGPPPEEVDNAAMVKTGSAPTSNSGVMNAVDATDQDFKGYAVRKKLRTSAIASASAAVPAV